MEAHHKSSIAAAWLSLFSNIILTIIKLIVGLLFHSQVLIADGMHSAADVVASLASLGSMKVSNLPADEDHPYGHGKAEIIASGVVSILLALAALMMAYKSIEALFTPAEPPHILALAAAILSLIWKQILYVYTVRIGRQANSKGLLATAYDHLADVYASAAAVVGIGIGLLGLHFHLPYSEYGDRAAGFIVSLLVLKLAFEMGKESMYTLMEGNISGEKIEVYVEAVIANPAVKRIDRIRAREHGHYIIVDIRVGVPGDLTIQQGHDISREIKQAIMSKDPDVQEVLVHLNPWYEKEGS
ncbi:cation diffusion facilitator family transporter [Aneurinibacillus sp. Ricciae_BoGa-3]|uniref:cation diffusion facilitator family transporter n=1 Tax=Aneurinibacillus sp. Ricciae_BoGa-3 TaxID=3022697 RepID=UPI00233FBE51|nr:cation diffusion facilitator family transporter [Aneurinibacillus sp. Ricciae_BoGa-3]WCK53401.1 cation diffusion facilitator family transporter [Aneurinibacillus sp. Ricciae_BoGa-3]